MKSLEFIPIVLFFLVYKLPEKSINLISPLVSDAFEQTLRDTKPFILATAVLIIATVIQMLINYRREGKIDRMNLAILALILVLGIPSILLQDPVLFMWKPTVANWLFAAFFFGSHWIGTGKPIIQRMLDKQISLPEPIWLKLSLAWVAFFILSGALNLIVAFNFSENTWVNFKLFGLLGLTLVFGIVQSIYLARYIQEDPSSLDQDS